MANTETRSDAQKRNARRNASNQFDAWEQRTSLAKKIAADLSASSDAKTAKLRALRLAKEEADRLAAAAMPPAPATKKKKTGA